MFMQRYSKLIISILVKKIDVVSHEKSIRLNLPVETCKKTISFSHFLANFITFLAPTVLIPNATSYLDNVIEI